MCLLHGCGWNCCVKLRGRISNLLEYNPGNASGYLPKAPLSIVVGPSGLEFDHDNVILQIKYVRVNYPGKGRLTTRAQHMDHLPAVPQAALERVGAPYPYTENLLCGMRDAKLRKLWDKNSKFVSINSTTHSACRIPHNYNRFEMLAPTPLGPSYLVN